MRILVLGGTQFLSRAVAAEFAARGHDVTCVARGRSGTAPARVRFVRADRDDPESLTPLTAEHWDTVLDVTRTPAHARAAVATLGPSADHWTYVSTCSVYADLATPGQAEDASLVTAAEPAEGESPWERYGEFKRACELAVTEGFAGGVLLVRPGLIVGPEDPSGRFAYWPRRMAADDVVLAPGSPDEPVQIIDVRDLARWLVSGAERRLTGVFNTVSEPMPRGELLESVARGVRVDGGPRLAWADQEFLEAHDVRMWSGDRSAPLWVPLPEYAGHMSRDVSAAIAEGLAVRPVEETARDTLAWLERTPDAAVTGLTDAEHAELLRHLHTGTMSS
ncbi:MAG: NAD-dependent epimerase/dehydratase family protein [Propionibacteriales bacterium]|nr:NAD-dependent epimerase/dehydratase family protein [Propionibacteriales bacterium]